MHHANHPADLLVSPHSPEKPTMPDMDVLADALAVADTAHAAKPAVLARASMTPEHAALSRRIGRGCHIKLPMPDASLSLHLAKNDPAAWGESVALAGPFGAIEFAQGVRLIRAFSGIDLGAELHADGERWDWLQAAVVARLAGTPFACADRLMHGPQPDMQDACLLRVTLRTGKHAITTHARAGAAAWLDFLQRASWTQERLPLSECLSLPFEAAVRIGRHVLPMHAFRTLAAGDIVLPDNANFSCRGTGLIQLGALHARVRYQTPGALRIVELEVKLDSQELNESADGDAIDDPLAADTTAEGAGIDEAMPEKLPEENGEGGESIQAKTDSAKLDAMPVTLDFELGKVRMSLGDLRALTVGSIMQLKDGSPASIAILSSGRLLGRGEVVDVNGRIGIRITQWDVK